MTNPTQKRDDWSRVFAAVAACLLVLLFAGCKTHDDKPDSADFASVEIRGHTMQQIQSVTSDVFHEHNYKATTGSLTSLVFEKEGTTMNNIAYGNWMGTGIASRVKLLFVPVTDDVFRIDCHAFLVRNKGETLEEEIPVTHIHHKQYQKMLDEIAKRLN